MGRNYPKIYTENLFLALKNNWINLERGKYPFHPRNRSFTNALHKKTCLGFAPRHASCIN